MPFRAFAGLTALAGLSWLLASGCGSGKAPRDQNYGTDLNRDWRFPDGGPPDAPIRQDTGPVADSAGRDGDAPQASDDGETDAASLEAGISG
jgi:hypothetical protein